METSGEARDAAFAEFATGAQASLLRTAVILTGDRSAAEDLVQSALIKVYVRWGRSASWESPQAYARKVVVNLYSTWRRRRWTSEVLRAEPAEPAGRDGEADFADSVVVHQELMRALAMLPRHQRTVLVLRFYEDLSVEQTAELMGCSAGTVKSRTLRAVQRLRAMDVLDRYLEEKAR